MPYEIPQFPKTYKIHKFAFWGEKSPKLAIILNLRILYVFNALKIFSLKHY
jgi:hypothetical protein